MPTIAAQNVRVIQGEQIPGTPAENIKHFEIEHQKVRAVFYNEKNAEGFMTKFSTSFSMDGKRYIENCDFVLKGNIIEASSTRNSSGHLLLMF